MAKSTGTSRVQSDGGSRQTRQGAQRDANLARGNSAGADALRSLGAQRDTAGRGGRGRTNRRGARRG